MQTKPLRPLAERWISVKNTSKPSPNTVAARLADLAAIGDHLGPSTHRHSDDKLGSLTDLTTNSLDVRDLEDAFASYASTHAASSVRRLMSTWRQFCLWLVREGELVANPLDHIESPGRAPWIPKPLQPEDLAAVAGEASLPSPTSRSPWPERDEALFALFIAAGVRVSEAIGMRIGDCYLDDDPPRLRIDGKGGKTRVVPIPPEAVDRLRRYLSSRTERLHGRAADAPLLLRPDGRPMTRSSVDHVVRGWFRRAGRTPPRGALVHSFRHTYATMLIDSGASLSEVQQLLGHADLATTQAYLGVTAKGLTDAAMANPARRLL